MKAMYWRSLLIAGALTAVGCGDSTSNNPLPGVDASDDQQDASGNDVTKPTDTPSTDRPMTDVATDVTSDVAADVSDASSDAADASDAMSDAPSKDVDDAATDAPADVTADVTDAATDVSMDAVTDVAADTATDTATDSSADASDAPASSCATLRGTITLPSASPVMLSGTTVGGINSITSTRCQSTTTGPDAVYSLVITARTGVILSTDNEGTAFDTNLSIRRNCTDAATELSCDDDSGIGTGRGASSVLRAVLEPGTYSVIVDGYSGTSGAYTLSATTFTPDANATCATARALTAGTPLTGQMITNPGAPSFCSPGLTPGGQIFYSATVPAMSSGTVRITRAMTTWSAALRVMADCDVTTCLTNTTSSASPATLSLLNTSASPRTYIVSVAPNYSDTTPTPFDIGLETTALLPGQTCDTAVALTAGVPLAAQSTMGAPVSTAPCRTETGGQRFYTVAIPAGQRVRVTATPPMTGAVAPVLRAFDGCAATTCIDNTIGGTSSTPAVATLDLPNSGTAPRTVYVSVASPTLATPGSWDVAAIASPIIPGQFCAEPVVVAPGMTLNDQDARNGLRASTACLTTANGGQVFYRVSVPAGQRVQVRAVPAGAMAAWTPTLRRIATCTSTTCADSNTASASGSAASLTLTNGGTAAADYLLSVSGTSASAGTFNLEVGAASALPGYTVAPITAMCDDLTMGTAVAPSGGSWSDDSVAPIAALPFTFSLMGSDVTRWAISSNGLLELFNATTGSTSTEYFNTTIPSTATPNGFVAAFWDDLTTVSGMTAGRTATLGTAPSRRFVVEWTNFTSVSDSTARLTFQAKLFETTNVVEIHYCSLAPATGSASGSNATIGVEDLTGSFGAQISYNTAAGATSGNGYRLTPR